MSEKMKICMMSSDFLPNIGGIAAHVYELSNSLSLLGHDISVITIRNNFSEDKHEKINNMNVYRIYYPKIPFIGYLVHLFLVWFEIKFLHNFDVIHIHTIRHAPVLKFLRCKSVETEHSSGFLMGMESSKSRWIYKWLFNSNDHLIAPSDEIAKKIIELGFDQDFVSSITNGIDVSKFNPIVDNEVIELKKSYNISAEDKVVLCPRRLVPKNGVEYFIESAPRIINSYGNNVKFLIVGSSSGNQLEILKKQVLDFNLEDKILFVGSIPNTEMPSFYVLSDIVILPSLMEATSIAGLEAMATGKPLVGTDVGGIPQIIDNCKTGILVPPKNPDKIAEAVTYLLKSDKKRMMMGNNARKRVKKQFSWEIIAKKTLSVYKNI